MYTTITDLYDDMKGTMTGAVPAPKVVGKTIEDMYKQANILADLYRVLKKSYKNENEYYELMFDASEVYNNVDKDALGGLRYVYDFGVIQSENERWIMSAMARLIEVDYTDGQLSVKGLTDGVVDRLQDIMDTGNYITPDNMTYIANDIYEAVAAMYNEIYMTYGLGRWIDDNMKSAQKNITRGFNEFLMRVNMSPEEVASDIAERMKEFIFISNEVDRDPEVSKIVRGKVPQDLVSDFEDVIELISADMVQDIVNGKIKITRAFITSLGEESFNGTNDDGDDVEDTDFSDIPSIEEV